MKILVIDNYDSFTYNLVQYIQKLTDAPVDVFRNDKITLDQIGFYDKIVLSPGPGVPDEAGVTKPLIKKYGHQKSILGVCLGHQAIGEVFGGNLVNMNKVFHGISTKINLKVKDEKLFKNMPETFNGGRYHSWIVDKKGLPDCLEITAEDDDGRIMAIRHKEFNVRGVQFHPESVLTENGIEIIKNWLKI